MSALDILQHLRGRGVTLTARDDGNLSAKPAGVLTDDERQQIKAHKPELIAILRQQRPPISLPPPVLALCGLDDAEIDRMVRYMGMAQRQGFNPDEAEEIADRLTLRDRQLDDRRMCIECRHLESTGRCAYARAGRLAGADRGFEPFKTDLIRCHGFRSSMKA